MSDVKAENIDDGHQNGAIQIEQKVVKINKSKKRKKSKTFIPELAFNRMRAHSENSDSDDSDYKPSKKSSRIAADSLRMGHPTRNGSVNSYKQEYLPSTSNTDSSESDVKASTLKNSRTKKSRVLKAKPKPKKSNPTNRKLKKKTSTKSSRDPFKVDLSSYSCKMYFKSAQFSNFDLLVKPVKYDFEQKLPDELLIKIFNIVLESSTKRAQTLIELSFVCEYWRNIIISTPILWQTLDLSSFVNINFPMATFEKLCSCNKLFSSVKSIDLTGWNGSCAEKIIDMVVNSSNFELESIIAKYTRNVSSGLLNAIMRSSSKIKALDLSGITSVSNSNHPFNMNSFGPFMEKCGPNIVNLYLSENKMTSLSNCFDLIMEHCSNLQVLDISNVFSFTKKRYLLVEKFQLHCPQLRVLRAANNCFISQPTMASGGFPLLEELSIPYTDNAMSSYCTIDDLVLEQLTKGSEKLTLLDIRGLSITPHCLLKIPTWSLKHLSISNCPALQDDTMEMIFTKWGKSLIDVDLSFNKSESSVNGCIRAISELNREEPRLESIQLRGAAITYEMLHRLIADCDKLKSIDLQSCRSLPRGIKRAFEGQDLTQFRKEMLEGKFN